MNSYIYLYVVSHPLKLQWLAHNVACKLISSITSQKNHCEYFFSHSYKQHVNFLCIYEDKIYQTKTFSRTISNAFGNQAVNFSGSESNHIFNSSTDNHITLEISSLSTFNIMSFECSGK